MSKAIGKTRLFVAMGSVLFVLALLGCDKDTAYLAFSHNLHVTENGIACADCHGKTQNGHFAVPGHAACNECHEEWVSAKKVEDKTCGMCHKVKELQKLSKAEPPKTAVKTGGVFVHTGAVSNQCASCHGSILNKALKRVPELTRGEKIRIRDQAHQSRKDCASCHIDMDPATAPTSHNENWTRRHGTLGQQPDNACGVCHTTESCKECHEVTMPASHNNLWRQKVHGTRANWDRARCQVCHEEDSCVACHSETRPQSHNAAWKENHCTQCHTSSSTGTGCSLCHDGTLDTHPNPHAAGWRSQHCNTCHFGSPEAEQCAACHGAGAHTNPHSAGWRASHCNSCHFGSDEAKCAVCHGGGAHTANPHSAGWQKRHCGSCHAGSQAAAECAPCHPGGSSVLLHQSFWPPVHDRFGDRIDCFECHVP